MPGTSRTVRRPWRSKPWQRSGKVTAKWSDLKLFGQTNGPRPLAQKDLGVVYDHFSKQVAAHGAELFKIGGPKSIPLQK